MDVRQQGFGVRHGEATPVARLLRRLDLERVRDDRFRGNPGSGEGRLFGGMVAAQAYVAAARTAGADRPLHSLHAYFLRPGRHAEPIDFEVRRLRDGRSFTTRRVEAVQRGEVIFTMTASFCTPEAGIAHQVRERPEAPPPATLPDWEDVRASILGVRRPDGPLEVRDCDPESGDPAVRRPPYRRIWMRPRGEVPADPEARTALLVFATDRTLLSTAARPHGLTWNNRMGASLDHAVWVHRLPRWDDWLLYESESPIARDARAVVFGALYDADGSRVASVAQEGVLRRQRS
jgi:acyl-CoA thioesterase-2